MKLCSQCHTLKSLDSFAYSTRNKKDHRGQPCKACVAAYDAEQYQLKKKVYYDKKYKEKTEEILTRNKVWREKNRLHMRALIAEYARAHPEERAETAQRYRARKRNAPLVERVYRKQVFERDKYICQLCFTKTSKDDPPEVDHVIPLSKGGNHTMANCVTTHKSCNRKKSNTTKIAQQMRLLG